MSDDLDGFEGDDPETVYAQGRSDISGEFTCMIRPQLFVIIGDLGESFGVEGGGHRDIQLFRNLLQEPEILTFDEILARAEWALDLAVESEG